MMLTCPRVRRMIAAVTLLLACAALAEAQAVRMHGQAARLVDEYCSPEQVAIIHRTLLATEQSTLGPQPLTDAERKMIAGPSEQVRLEPQAFADSGRGTAEDPYRNAIHNYLAKHAPDFDEPHAIVVPAGDYRELNVDVPADVWLIAEGDVFITPDDFNPDDHPLGSSRLTSTPVAFTLHRDSGLVGFTIDGSRAKVFSGVALAMDAERAVVAQNHIMNMAHGRGIFEVPSRGAREGGSEVVVLANHLERIGGSGIRSAHKWLVKNNTVIHVGYHRKGGQGWGGDGIIPGAKLEGGRILNNLCIMSKSSDLYEDNCARHAMAAQSMMRTEYRGNLAILEGKLRGGIVLSDYSWENQVIGNVVICRPGPTGRAGFGILINGAENDVTHNVVFGPRVGLHHNVHKEDPHWIVKYRPERREPQRPSRSGNAIAHNYLQAVRPMRIWGTNHYDQPHNTIEENIEVPFDPDTSQ